MIVLTASSVGPKKNRKKSMRCTAGPIERGKSSYSLFSFVCLFLLCLGKKKLRGTREGGSDEISIHFCVMNDARHIPPSSFFSLYFLFEF